jgi:tetratricopeptide (TPR) repeat protein
MAAGDSAAAEATYRDLLATQGESVEITAALFGLLEEQGRTDEAREVVESALTTAPSDPNLLWIKAGLLEKSGEFEEAIAIYETMYQADSNNQIIANNLASMLADHRSDPESLNRAYTVARRLRGSDVPPFQDTYGWIAFLRGETDEALAATAPAAEVLSSDPAVQFHLAEIYRKLGRDEEALAQYLKVAELTTEADTRAFVVESRAQIARLKAAAGAQ